MTLVPLTEINDDEEFFIGTRFRIYNVGLNVQKKEDDFYEYMLTQVPGESEHLNMSNVNGHKAGYSLALVKLKIGTLVVTGKALKFSIGTKNTFLVRVS